MLSNPISGLYHAGGPRRLSLFKIAQIVNRVGGYDPKLLKGCPRIDAGPMPPRAGNVTLDSSKLTETLGYAPFDPWPLDDELVPYDRDWHHAVEEVDLGNMSVGNEKMIHKLLYQNPSNPGFILRIANSYGKAESSLNGLSWYKTNTHH